MARDKELKNKGVAFDIGTASVSATLFELPGDEKKPNVIKTFRRFHRTPLKKDAIHFSRSTIGQFSLILKDILAYTKGAAPHYYAIGLSSVFYLGKTERLYFEQKEPFQITQKLIQDFINSGREKFLSDLAREDLVMFETVLMKALYNGYAIESPIGNSAEEIELWVHFAATSKDLYEKLTEIIMSYEKRAEIRFETFPIASWNLMRQILLPDQHVLLVDIGGEITEVTFLVNGVITEVLSLPFGVLNILLRIAESEHVEVENALSLLKGYTEGTFDEETQKRLRAIIKKEIKTWEETFERVWQRSSRDMMINIRILFLGGGSLITELKDAVTPPLLHPDIAKGLQASAVTPDSFRDKFGTFCCFDGAGDFGLLSLILNTRV